MRKFYFVGGPKTGQSEEFFRRLDEIGGTPAGWHIYPHTVIDGKALHIVDAGSQDEIVEHLQNFQGIYEWTDIIEILEGRQ